MKNEIMGLLVAFKAKAWVMVVVCFSFFSPIHWVFALLGLGIILDTYVGRWAAKHKAIKEGLDVRIYVSSKKTRYGLLSKMISYNLAIATLFIMDSFLLNDLAKFFLPTLPIAFLVTKLVGLGLIYIEFDSIDESYYKVKGISLKTKLKISFGKIKIIVGQLLGFKKEIEDKLKDK